MSRGIRNAVSVALFTTGLFVAGCGTDSSSCATETPQLGQAPSCPALAPNTRVQVSFQICPTCNQTDAECQVDMNGISSGIIHFDTLVHACDTSNSCPPSCSQSGVTCSFTTPGPGNYTLYIGDSTTPYQLTVGNTGASTCG